MMEEVFNTLRNLVVSTISMLLAYFAPVGNFVFVIFFVFLVNCVAGLIADIYANDERFRIKKFFRCLVETMVFYMIVVCIYTVGERMGNPAGAIQCITGVVYAVLYFYSVNVLRNVKEILPSSRAIAFLYYVVSFEMLKKVPFLENFVRREENR